MGERRGTKGLELWCRKMTEGYPGVKIDNMTTSWRDGLAFCAIIHHFRPDLIDFAKLNKDDIYHNNELAFTVAEHHLGIPALLEPEDMVEYTVPDRLSILTYLSQFYQAFAVPQGSSSARIAAKRPQTSPDHGIVSPASTSPPTKVAFTGAGKIRREPCAKCGLPVFIAERLNVGKLLYHRTCFRCARCNSQLTLANYYETENGEYCCEICPDEEKIALKTSPEKSVLSRSMSDEEKTASLKTFSNEPDDYSSLFETALESIGDDSLRKELTLTRDDSSEFTKARSEFFQSQMEDSGNDDEPPDLPKSIPPKLDKSELTNSEDTISLKNSVVTISAHSDSGFPNNRLDEIVNMDNSKSSVSNQFVNASVELDKTHNIVTKDRSAEEGDTSLVKARMRLFESNKSTDINDFRKSDVHRNSQNTDKVPLTSAKSPTHHSEILKSTPIPIVKLDDLENFEQLSKKDLENDVNVIDDNKISTEKSTVPLNTDSFKHSDKNISDEYIGDKAQINKIKNTIATVSVFDKKRETDTQNIIKKELNPVPVFVKDSEIEPKDDSNDVINVDDSVLTVNSSEESENSVIIVEDSPMTRQSPNTDIPVTPTITIDTSVETSFQNSEVISPVSFSKTEYKTTDDDVSPEDESTSDVKLKDATETDEQIAKPAEEDYPDDLNPFDEEEEAEDEQKHKQANISLNPFDDDDDVEEEVIKPVPSPRLRKKLLPHDSDKHITGTPEHLSGVFIQRVSVNPFESDDEEGSKTEGKPPMPAARKKKLIAAPKISLNPFWSEDEENEDGNLKQPVPKPRTSRTTLGVPEPKPRESGGLSLSTRSNFGSNSSISSGSAYGSVRKKKPAPPPPTPAKSEHYESTTSSLASSPSHSVQHSPKLNQKYRKSKKAPPPPSSSTPLPPRKEIEPEANRLSSTALSPIKLDNSESTVKDNAQKDTENDIEQEKIVKDEMNRNRQSQNIGLQSPTDSETSSSLSAPNKSTYGKWKRRKGQAPTRPIPQRRSIKCLPMTEIRRELEVIEIQQQGLERQGVRLEQIIREKCEGTGIDSTTNTDDSLPIDVEDLILQLFELVNEKNDLFRKQAELMYLRRQQRLEEEHADVEYQIRCLMLQPEANKTDSDKAREEELINRLVEIVERRNEIIECLEMDRVREAEEDDSINNHINLYTLKRDGDKLESDKTKKEKEKDKKKHKKEKKPKYKDKGHKIDADKDIDESEPCSTLEKKKKKKFNIF